jgi:tRNA threonylcarbamoyladenosine biosynthesis protein TsaB
MRVLALDTTTREGSVALVDDDRVMEVRSGDASRTHAERLPRDIVDLLEAHRVAIGDLDLFAVASGPGSFTGLRVGIATIQGLAFATGRRVVTVSALDALAHAAAERLAPGTLVAAWMDAHRREVFAALYGVTAAPFGPERLAGVEGATVGEPQAILERWSRTPEGRPSWFVGDAAVLYATAIRAGATSEPHILAAPPLAGIVGRLAVRRARAGETVAPGGVQPLYVRRPDAEVARDRARR